MGKISKKTKTQPVSQPQKKSKKEVFKLTLFGMARTAILMISLLLLVKNYYLYGGIGIAIYAVVLFLEKRYKMKNEK